MNYTSLISLIRNLRIKHNYSQLYMAKCLQSDDEDFYGRIERYEKELSVYCLKRIGHTLHTPPIVLLHLSGYMCFTPPPATNY
jgi:hypothetical protein